MAAWRQMQKGGYTAIRRDHTSRDRVTLRESPTSQLLFEAAGMNNGFVISGTARLSEEYRHVG
jgi:hypothetical protein